MRPADNGPKVGDFGQRNIIFVSQSLIWLWRNLSYGLWPVVKLILRSWDRQIKVQKSETLDNVTFSLFVKVLPDFDGTYLTVFDRL